MDLCGEVYIEQWLDLLCSMPQLRHVSVVFGPFWGMEHPLCDPLSGDMANFGHFKLAPYTEESAEILPGAGESALWTRLRQGDAGSPVVFVTEYISDVVQQLLQRRVEDEDHAPWDKASGQCLFEFTAMKMMRAPENPA